jgi:Cdc6-like AAA superfamily ATPase
MKMSDVSDAADFIEAAGNNQTPSYGDGETLRPKGLAAVLKAMSGNDEDKPIPGKKTQYELYGGGYAASNSTIKTLPPGCYDITADQRCTYVTPMPKPTGLLLELPEMRSEEVVNMVETFWNSEKDYKDGNEFVIGGAAFKAGIMLYGPPGTGKSCTIKIVANKLVERGGTVFFSSGNPHYSMGFLEEFAQIEKDRKCIVILEDIDSLIHHYGEGTYLEMLDSAKSIDNVLFIATTNYPDRLDPRIYNRPGRFSHVVKIGLPGPKARKAYLEAILKNHRDVEFIVDNTTNFSIDHLSALINAHYREKKDLASEIERLKMLFKVPKAEEEKRMGISIGIGE